ncbi:MAG: ATP-binding protein [Saprospiraceae bacterium]|nr:ATP-binding protein [Saprospiraceae bacterium]
MKNLPIGIQTFREIRQRDYLYVDKTPQIHRLISSGKYFFLSRPRRFGKSLTLSTIREIYSGNRDLFEGLWIEDQWDWTKVRPVIHIQFNSIGYFSNGLENALNEALNQEAERYGLVLSASSYDQRFFELIKKLSSTQGKVVLLIDEYDKPLIDYLEKDQLPTAFEHQRILKNFYSIIKSADPYLEFLLITGVSKFSKVSVFSDLNNLNDITIDDNYSDLVGYTQDELESTFTQWIDHCLQKMKSFSKDTLLANIKNWYDGYTWDGEVHVYNPFSILNFFSKSSFQDYWFKTGTPTFLIHKIKEAGHFNFNDLKVSGLIFESYSLDNLETRSLLFQTGYLTIKSIDYTRGIYTLGYPNREVEQAMTGHLLSALLHRAAPETVAPVLQLEEAFFANDLARVVVVINAMLKDVPSHLLDEKGEHFYHALVHLHFRYLGLFIQSEVHTSDGRMDAVVHTPTHIYLLEFKINQSAEAALEQIHRKGYADKFRLENKTLIGVGINFDTAKRNVSDWAEQAL